MGKRRDKIERGAALTAQSWTVLKKDASLMLFPILAMIIGYAAMAAILLPTLGLNEIETILDNRHPFTALILTGNPMYYLAVVGAFYAATLIATFFNVALAACAARSFRGEDTTVSEGIAAAVGRLGPILGWTLLTTTVGLILQLLAEQFEFVGRIAAWIAGAAWSIAAFFVVPAVALEGAGPIAALKRSAVVVKARWGEGATGAVIVTAASGFITIPIVIGGVIGYLLFVNAHQHLVGAVIIAIAVAALLAVSVASSALNQIFRVALYQYATTGTVAGGFDGRELEAAFDRP